MDGAKKLIFGQTRFELYTPDQFPNWIRCSAIWVCEHHSRLWFYDSKYQAYDPKSLSRDPEQHRKAINTLKRPIRCLNSLTMKETWLKINDLFYPGDPEKSQAWFAKAIVGCCLHPKSELMTRGEAANWKENTIAKLTKAKDAMNSMPDNYLDFVQAYRNVRLSRLQNFDRSKNETPFAAMNWCLYSGEDHPIPVLEAAIEALLKIEFDPGFSGSHIAGEAAERQFFTRSLTAAIFQKTGKKYRKIVAETTSAAFDCNITVREVVRLTKTLGDDAASNAKDYLLASITEDYISDLCEESKIAESSWKNKQRFS